MLLAMLDRKKEEIQESFDITQFSSLFIDFILLNVEKEIIQKTTKNQ
jgi:hypothetical protein